MASSVPLRGIRMEDELYLKLKAIAKREKRSFNQQALAIFETFVTQYEKEHGKLLVDVDELYKLRN